MACRDSTVRDCSYGKRNMEHIKNMEHIRNMDDRNGKDAGTDIRAWEQLNEQGMEAYFQPIYNVSEKRLTGLEALFRARDGEGGYLDPETLVLKAEEEGWVHQIDLWMVRECCRWYTRFAEYGITRMNLNLSPQTFMEEHAAQEITGCLDRYGLQHGKIWLEMTELGRSADSGKLLETAQELQKKKFNLVMDDFGKGESNFIRLMDFEFQSIKLDKELVWGIRNRKMGMPIVQTLLVFAQRNHIWVTAEGIETAEQAETLTRLGCNYLQGYLISRPLPAQECVSFIRQWEDTDILGQRMA